VKLDETGIRWMMKVGRNDPCPCGSGKKFKKCHLGREDELFQEGRSAFPEEMGKKITSLPEVAYGRSREMIQALDMESLTGTRFGVRFIDLHAYEALNVTDERLSNRKKGGSGGVMVNIQKTATSDPDHIYVAITPTISDSALIHELAHVFDYLGGSKLMPGLAKPLSFELGIPIEHIEHPYEFGYWLKYLQEQFQVELDADDTIVGYLYEQGMLIKGADITGQNGLALKTRSDEILRFLSGNSAEIDALICERTGYIGSRIKKEE
jgi:hypothetical protein